MGKREIPPAVVVIVVVVVLALVGYFFWQRIQPSEHPSPNMHPKDMGGQGRPGVPPGKGPPSLESGKG